MPARLLKSLTGNGRPDRESIRAGFRRLCAQLIRSAIILGAAGGATSGLWILTGSPAAAAEPPLDCCDAGADARVWREGADRRLFVDFRTSCLGARDRYPEGYRGRYAMRPTVVAFESKWQAPRVTACLSVAAELLHECDIEILSVATTIVSVPKSLLALSLTELNRFARATPGRSRRSMHTYFIDRFAAGDAMAAAIAPAAGAVAGGTVWITTRTTQRPHSSASSRRLRKRLQREQLTDPDPADLEVAMNDVKCGMTLAHEYAHVLRNDHVVVTRARHDERGHTQARGNMMAQGASADAYLRGKRRFTAAQCRDIVESGVRNAILHDRKDRGRSLNRSEASTGRASRAFGAADPGRR